MIVFNSFSWRSPSSGVSVLGLIVVVHGYRLSAPVMVMRGVPRIHKTTFQMTRSCMNTQRGTAKSTNLANSLFNRHELHEFHGPRSRTSGTKTPGHQDQGTAELANEGDPAVRHYHPRTCHTGDAVGRPVLVSSCRMVPFVRDLKPCDSWGSCRLNCAPGEVRDLSRDHRVFVTLRVI